MLTIKKMALIVAATVGATFAHAEQNNGVEAAWRAAMQVRSTMGEDRAPMTEAINGTAGEIVEAFMGYTNAKTPFAAVSEFAFQSSLSGWLIDDDAGFKPRGRFMTDSALKAVRSNVVLPGTKPTPWFKPFDASMQAFAGGNLAAGEDLALRVFALANLHQFAMNQVGEQRVNGAGQYFLLSRQAQFARIFSERLTERLQSKYQTAEAFKIDFVRAVMAIPQEQIKDIFVAARLNAQGITPYTASFVLGDETSRWEEKGEGYAYSYTYNPTRGLTIATNGKPLYGVVFVGGKVASLQLVNASK